MIFASLFGAATLENPQYSLNDLAELMAGPPSAAGVRVNRETVMTYSPYIRGKNLLARDTAKLPLHIYQRVETPDGEDRERYKTHSSYRALRRKANQFTTAFQFRLVLTGHAIDGNGYAYIVRRNDGTLVPPEEGGGLIILDPKCTYPIKEHVGGKSTLWYVTQIGDEYRKLSPENVLHIKGLGYDGLCGYDVISLARDAIGLGKAQELYRSKFFSNGAHMKVVLETPGNIGQNQAKEILASWQRMQGGLDKAHLTAILHSGLKANVLNQNARESQLAEGVELSIRDVANILGIPPHKLGAKTGESYASKEQENLDYLFQALDFWLVAWEDECFDKLLTEEEKVEETAYVEFSREKLFETDLKTKAEYWRIALGGAPWAAVNQARRSFNMSPVPGGDVVQSPLNMGPNNNDPGGPGGTDDEDEDAVDDEADEDVDETDEEEDEEEEQDEEATARLRSALTAQLRSTVSRMVRRAGHGAEAVAKDGKRFMAWLDSFPESQEQIAKDVHDVQAACCAFTGRDTQALAGLIVSTMHGDLIEWSGTVTAAQLAEQLPEQVKRLDEQLQAAAVETLMGAKHEPA